MVESQPTNPPSNKKNEWRDIFLLGAGFSRALMPSMPLMKDFNEKLLSDSRWKQWADIGNFEEVMTYLSERSPWENQATSLRKRADFLDLSLQIAKIVNEAHGSFVPIAAEIRQLVESMHINVTPILSLNYDLLLEGLFSIFNFPTGDLYPVPLTHHLARDGSSVITDQRTKTAKLFKLHGSVSWYYSGGESFMGETIYHVPYWPLPEDTSASMILDKVPLIVPPTLHKSTFFKSETIEALWRLAGMSLWSANRLIVIGYSVPTSDILMHFFLRAKGKNIREVHLVDPSEAPLINLQKALNDKSIEFRHHGGENALSDFIRWYLS